MIDISVSNLSKEFEVGKKILDGLTFQIDQGERVGLLGKNGAGKTTLFKILTGELDWDDGEVHIAPGKGVGLISRRSTRWRTCSRPPSGGSGPWSGRWRN